MEITLNEIKPYVVPETQIPPLTATYKEPEPVSITKEVSKGYFAPEQYVPQSEATVQGQMSGLLDSGSMYLEAARRRGERAAQARGLLNSSIAATAGEAAAIEGALPIAQQDAQAFQTAGMAGYTGKLNAAAAAQAYENQRGLIGVQAQAQSELQRQQAREAAAMESYRGQLAADLAAQDAAHKRALAHVQAGIASGLSLQEAQQQAALAAKQALLQAGLNEKEAAAEMERLKTKLASDRSLLDKQAAHDREMEAVRQAGANERAKAEGEIERARISAAEKQDLQARLASAADLYSRQIADIQSNISTTPEVKTTILNQVRTSYINTVNMLSTLAGVKLEWTPPEEVTPPPAPPPPAPPVIPPPIGPGSDIGGA